MRPFNGPSHHLLYNGPISRRIFALPSILKLGSRNTGSQFLKCRLASRYSQARQFYASNSYAQPHTRWQRRKTLTFMIVWGSICCIPNACYVVANWYPTKDISRKLLTFIEQNFVCSWSNLNEWRWWTLFSSSIMHYSPLHLAVNLIGFSSFAPLTLEIWGVATFVCIWMGGAMCASILQLVSDAYPDLKNSLAKGDKGHENSKGNIERGTRIIGASGSVLAYFSIYAAMMPFAKVIFFPIPFGFPIWAAFLGIFGFSASSWYNNWFPAIGHAAHMGGLAFGSTFVLVQKALRRWR